MSTVAQGRTMRNGTVTDVPPSTLLTVTRGLRPA